VKHQGKLLEILKKVLPRDVKAEISVLARSVGETCAQANALIQGSHRDELLVDVRVEQGGFVGRHTDSRLTIEGLRKAIAKARSNAAQGIPGPLLLTGDTGYREMKVFFPATAGQTPAQRAESLAPLIDMARRLDVSIDASLRSETGQLTIANTAGLAATVPVTFARFAVAVSGRGQGRGYGYACSRDAGHLRLMDVFLEAAAKSQASAFPQSIAAGQYIVVLEPAAVAALLGVLAKTAFSGRAFLRRCSPVTEIGAKIFGDNINIWDDGLDPRGLAVPCDFQGVPKQRLHLVSKGAVVNVACNNEVAAALNLPGTGHASGPGTDGSQPSHIFLEAGNAMLDDMIASTRRGILVSRLDGLKILDSRRCLVTGVTAGGTLLIENGRLTAALPGLRFIQDLVALFNQVEMIGDEPRLFGGLWGGVSAPALKADGFTVLSSPAGLGLRQGVW